MKQNLGFIDMHGGDGNMYTMSDLVNVQKSIARVKGTALYKAIEKNSISVSESGVKKNAAMLYDKEFVSIRQIRARYMNVDFWILRHMSHKGVIIPAIINTRLEQVAPFTEIYREGNENQQGFVIAHKDKEHKITRQEKKEIRELEDFVLNCGYTSKNYKGANAQLLDNREDDFSGFTNKFIRDMLVIDQMAIELQKNKKRELVAFHILDGASVSRTTEHGYEGDPNITFVQEYRGKPVALFTNDDLIFAYKNRRSDMEAHGFGFGPLEQMLDIVTAILFATQYNKQQFSQSSMIQGFFSLKGEMDDVTLREMQRQWAANFRGVQGAWKIPFMAASDGVEFKQFRANNKDMEFNKYLDFLMMVACAVFNISVDELAIRLEKSAPVMSENVAPRIEYSKDRGLRGILAFWQKTVNKILSHHPLGEKYEFKVVGLFKEDKKMAMDVAKAKQELFTSINATRLEKGMPPILGPDGLPSWWAELPGNVLQNPTLFNYLVTKYDPQKPQNPFEGLLAGLKGGEGIGGGGGEEEAQGGEQGDNQGAPEAGGEEEEPAQAVPEKPAKKGGGFMQKAFIRNPKKETLQKAIDGSSGSDALVAGDVPTLDLKSKKAEKKQDKKPGMFKRVFNKVKGLFKKSEPEPEIVKPQATRLYVRRGTRKP